MYVRRSFQGEVIYVTGIYALFYYGPQDFIIPITQEEINDCDRKRFNKIIK
jgi:hypothetical protein